MSSPSVEPKFVLVAGAKVIAGSDGAVTLISGARQIETELPDFPWREFFSFCSVEPKTIQELVDRLGDVEPVARELVRLGILVPATAYRATSEYHRASSFGEHYQPHPSPLDGRLNFPQSARTTIPLESAVNSPWKRMLSERHSTREFSGEALSQETLATLLWASYGVIPGTTRRVVPSAGGLYGLRVFVLASSIKGLARGLYEYEPHGAQLRKHDETVLPADLNTLFRTTRIDFAKCSLAVLFVGRIGYTSRNYGERSYRYLLLESGHAAQNLTVCAATLGVRCVPVGAVEDAIVTEFLGLNPVTELPLYAVVLGS